MEVYDATDYYPQADDDDPDVRRYWIGLARARFIVDALNAERTGKWNGPPARKTVGNLDEYQKQEM